VEVKAACGTNFEVSLEVLLLHRIAARVALAKEPLAESFLLVCVDSRFGFRELHHGGWLA
jgi:hypothetical protein